MGFLEPRLLVIGPASTPENFLFVSADTGDSLLCLSGLWLPLQPFLYILENVVRSQIGVCLVDCPKFHTYCFSGKEMSHHRVPKTWSQPSAPPVLTPVS